LFATAATGDLNPKSGDNLTFNSNTGLLTATSFSGNLTGSVNGNLTGTLQTAAQGNVTSLGTLTTLTVDNVKINGTQIGHTSDTDLITLGDKRVTIAGGLVVDSCDISGDVDIDGTLEADAITIAGVTLAETISDTVGAMVGSNTETNIAVTYQDGDNTLDFEVTSIPATTVASGNLGSGVQPYFTANNTNAALKVPFASVDTHASVNADLRIDDDAGKFTYNPSNGSLAGLGSVTTDSATVGTLTVTGGATFGDADKLIFGDGGDLEIFHDPSGSPASFIKDVGAGPLVLSGTQVAVMNPSIDEYMINATDDGAVDLYYDGSKKLETVTGGVTITGILTTTGNIELGHASDTTIARSSAGNVTIEGNEIYRAGGTDVPVADGGTGASSAADARTNLGFGNMSILNGHFQISDFNWSGTDLAVANGGTGASTADSARDNLDIQVYIEAEGSGTPSAADFTNNNAILVVQY